MSTIGFALQFDPAQYAHLGSIEQQLQFAREARFDYLVWKSGDRPTPETLRAGQESTRTRVVAAQIPFAQFLEQPAQVLAYWKELEVPDLLLDEVPQPVPVDALKAALDLAVEHSIRISCVLPGPAEELEGLDCHIAVDTGRALNADEDPATLIRKYADRSPFVILHDVAPSAPGALAALGTGAQRWEDIFDAGEEAAAEWYVAGAECVVATDLESLRQAYDFLTRNG